jgi:hypothetical protein
MRSARRRFLKKKKLKYDKDMPKRLYTFFANYNESQGAPSFEKFARSIGSTVEELKALRQHDEFNRAWLEAEEIRRDYLIDAALVKRFDPSFVKYLLSEADREDAEGDSSVSVLITVSD